MDRWKRPWAQLAEAVRQGAAVDNQAKWLGEDPQFMRDFILGMHQFAARSGPQFAEALKDLPVRRLIDVGGGAGTYDRAVRRASRGAGGDPGPGAGGGHHARDSARRRPG